MFVKNAFKNTDIQMMPGSITIAITSTLLLVIFVRLLVVRRRHKKARELLSQTRDQLVVAEDVALKLRELTAALENTVDGIARLDANGNYLTVNKSHASITGFKFEEIIGRPWWTTIHPDELSDIRNYYQQLKEFGKAEFETRGVRRNGQVYWQRVSWHAVYDENKKFIGHFSFLKDLTEQKNSEAIIEEQRARMLQTAKLSALGEMAGGVAHEINSPLTVITLSVDHIRDLLEEETLDKDAALRSLERIENTSFRIARIIKSLKMFCSEGSTQPTTEIPVRELIEDTLSFCSERFLNESIDLQVPPIADLTISCRPVEVSQVLLNLLNNSFDAVMSESERWIRLEVVDVDDHILISCSDSGSGIPIEVREKMMQPFFTTKQPGQGSGLGLSISRGIAEAHGGELYFDAHSKHTRFVLKLPKQTRATHPNAA